MPKQLMIALAGLVLSTAALAGKDPVFSTGDGAIRGYDPVAYFTEKRPVKGSEQYTHDHQGATWRFTSAENRDRFAASPETYTPQFGGYCAYAVGNGYTASIDPDAWSLVDGKLYLNYSKSVQARWEAKRDHYIRAANGNWPAVLDE
jgi:YHS domain-containing protein